MNPEWFDDESVLPSVLLTELDEHTRALFKQLCMLNCGIQLVRFLVEKLGLVRQVAVDDLTLFGMTMDSGRRQLMRELCVWQEHWHTRLVRIERAIDGKEVQEENRGIYANG